MTGKAEPVAASISPKSSDDNRSSPHPITEIDAAPDWHDAADFLCVRCARRRKTCCQVSEIFVTVQDVQRIEEYSQQRDFYGFRRPDNEEYADQDDDPTWRDHVFRADGSRRVLNRRPNGDCTFLGEAGCALPYHVRPLVCRLYPFEYTASGLSGELSNGCPTELLPTGQGLINALEMDVVMAEAWRDQLYREIQQEERP